MPSQPLRDPFLRWGPNVAARRTQLGLPLSELARRADISAKHLGQIEAGNSLPSYDVQERLAGQLERSITELFPRDEAEAELPVLAERLGAGCS